MYIGSIWERLVRLNKDRLFISVQGKSQNYLMKSSLESVLSFLKDNVHFDDELSFEDAGYEFILSSKESEDSELFNSEKILFDKSVLERLQYDSFKIVGNILNMNMLPKYNSIIWSERLDGTFSGFLFYTKINGNYVLLDYEGFVHSKEDMIGWKDVNLL